ncbi:MAG TPA: nucleotidyltransferase domain-containing protein [Candidatus Pacearchaeota archaeon]|nr:nucleotidyltransferase domain-containing protein [Candidatus Pacearchaeota archaeon]
METKVTSNYYKVLSVLENKENHSRGLSREINISHAQITKILNFFYQQNVLQKKEFGKSIVYSINKNFTTQQYLVSLSKQKLIHLTQNNPKLKVIIEEVISKINKDVFKIDCMILFGSYSKQSSNKNSDIDIFFITELKKEKLKIISKKISESYGIDINIKILNKEDFINQIKHPLTKEVLIGTPILNSELFYTLKWQE